MTRTVIRDAATVILLRDSTTTPRVLMGQRGAKAAFMPSKFVFPGGAIDDEDAELPFGRPINGWCRDRLTNDAGNADPAAIVAAAIRELWEETGLILGVPGRWPSRPPASWASFAATGHLPAADALRFVFRAITPPDRPRRFDARFFAADATAVAGDPDDFSAATDELSHLFWASLDDVLTLDLPFVTAVALAEVAAHLPGLEAPATVPFFRDDDEEKLFLRLGGKSPLAR